MTITALQTWEREVHAIVRYFAPLWPSQRRALMDYLKRAGIPDTSEARSAFYASVPGCNVPAGTRTNDLTYEQAQELLRVLSRMDPDKLAQAGAP